MISPRSVYQFFAVIVVDALAWPVNKAIDALDFSDIGDDADE